MKQDKLEFLTFLSFLMVNWFKNYGQMIARETSFPWQTKQRNSEIAQLTDVDSDEKKDGVVTKTHSVKSDESVPFTPDIGPIDATDERQEAQIQAAEENKQAPKGLGKYWAVIATGAGLFSDGYVNNNSSSMITFIETIYPKSVYSKSDAISNLSALVFLGTVVGMLVFGLIADYWSRKISMLISTTVLIVFSILCAGSWGIGAPEDPKGMLDMLITMRTFVGLGIGGEYPAGSVACAETSQRLSNGSRNRWFVWFTDFMIDCGFVVSAVTAWVLLYICDVPKYAEPGNSHGLQTVWRVLIGLGALPPLSLFYLRLKYEDDDQFKKNNFQKIKTPWWLIIKRYGPRVFWVGMMWFLYDWVSYGFTTYSGLIIKSQVPVNSDGVSNIYTYAGWQIVFNLFYIPGSFLGGLSADYFGPRLTYQIGNYLQGMVGFIMGAKYNTLSENIAPLVVCYGIFETLGEFGPGDNIGLISSKTCASSIRGRYYAIAAALGKIGAFAASYAFPAIQANFNKNEGQTVLVYIASAFCMVCGTMAFFLPELSQEAVALEDIKFRNYLSENGYDPALMEH